MADNKFIFTTEGRRSLVSQLGGIRFAVLGAVLVRGLTICDINSDDDTTEFEETYKDLTLDDLTLDKGIVLGMKNVSYKAPGGGRVIPESNEDYLEAFSNIVNNTLPMQYIPSIELSDKQNNVYGTYEFDFDKTLIAWDMANDISFQHLILLGKQYAETNDATFNVAETQKPVIVGIAQLTNVEDYERGGLQLLKEQNEYIATKLKLRFTLDEHDRDIATSISIDPEIKEISDKISLVNNGLKTMTDKGVTMAIVNDKKVIEDLNLSDEGGIATTKTLMVAHEFNADELENQLNPASLVHIVNREYDENRYRKQLVLTTIEKNSAPDVGVFNAYHVQLLLKGTGETIPETTYVNPYINPTGSGSSGSSGSSGAPVPVVYQGTESPVFRQSTVPEQDRVAVDMFGLENNILGEDNFDILLFSKGNVTLDPYGINDDGAGENLLLKSNYNYFNFTGANTDNVLINADYNMIVNGSLSNLLFGADANILDDVQGNALFATNFNNIDRDSYYNVILGGNYHRIANSNNVIMLGHEGLLASTVSEQVLFGKYNINCEAKIVYGIGTSDADRKNALEFYPERGELKLFKDGVEKVTVGGDAGLTISSLDLNNLKANYITAHNRLIVHETGTGGGINLYYNPTQNVAGLQMQGPGISGPYMSYYTDTGRLSVAYNTPQYSHGTYIQNEYIECIETNQYGAEFILINKDINNELDTYNSNGVLTVYGAHAVPNEGSDHSKVNIYPDSIKFSKFNENTNTWNIVREIGNTPEYSYRKVRADIYVWGTFDTGTTFDNWHVDIKYFKGPDAVKEWLTNIFRKCPPIIYSDSSSVSTVDCSYVKQTGDNTWQNYGIIGNDMTSIGDYNQTVQANGNLALGGQDFITYIADNHTLIYKSKIPSSFNLDELEINLFIHGKHRCGFIWMPFMETYQGVTIPEIKVNVRLDSGNGDKDLYVWVNHNYDTTGDYTFENYNIDYDNPVKLFSVPYDYSLGDTSTVSNPHAWWMDKK